MGPLPFSLNSHGSTFPPFPRPSRLPFLTLPFFAFMFSLLFGCWVRLVQPHRIVNLRNQSLSYVASPYLARFGSHTLFQSMHFLFILSDFSSFYLCSICLPMFYVFVFFGLSIYRCVHPSIYLFIVVCFKGFCFVCFSPPVRWGLLDFMYVFLLLFLFLFLFFFFFFLLFLLFSSSSQTSSPSSSPDVARCQHGPPDFSGQCRTSLASSRLQWAAPGLNSGRQIAVGTAGPQPGGSGADWATPDLNRRALERTGQRRTSPGDLPSGVGSAGPQQPEDVSEICQKECQKICQKKCQKMRQKICQKKCQKICRKRMSEEMSEDMSEEMSEEMPEEMSEDMSKDMSKICSTRMSEDMSIEMSDNMSERNVRRNVRRYVR